MSSVLEVVGPKTGAAPLRYTLSELGTVHVETIFAHFDGASASGAWRPVVTIRSQDGTLLSRTFPASSLAAGDTADVTYAPFLRSESAAGIQFDKQPQSGGFLTVTTLTGQIVVQDNSGDGIYLTSQDADGLNGFIGITTPSGGVFLGSDTIVNRVGVKFEVQGAGGAQRLVMQETGDTLLRLDTGTSLDIRGVFSVQRFRVDENGDLTVNLEASGGRLLVQANNVPIFRVDSDGSIHGITGGSITWDL